jgi:Flp pilus assembly protein TadG
MFKRIKNRESEDKQDQFALDNPVPESGQRGQSLVEMAILMVVLLLIMAGVLDFGRMYFTYLALQNAAGEGAAYGAINPTWVNSGDNADPNNIEYRVRNESSGTLIDWSTTTIVVDVPSIAGGAPITVSVSYVYEVITPMMEVITGDTVTLTARDTQLIFLDEND